MDNDMWEFDVVMDKRINLQFPGRMVKFDNLPQKYKDILDGAS
jgi:hypothetical protein